jgi:hypothetical protein
MRLYDGVDVRLLSDQQLKTEHDTITKGRYNSFYKTRLGYLWFRSREVYYEMERRGIASGTPSSFIGKKRENFNYWTPPFKEVYNAKVRLSIDMTEGHTHYGKPITRKHKDSIVPVF